MKPLSDFLKSLRQYINEHDKSVKQTLSAEKNVYRNDHQLRMYGLHRDCDLFIIKQFLEELFKCA